MKKTANDGSKAAETSKHARSHSISINGTIFGFILVIGIVANVVLHDLFSSLANIAQG